MNIHNLVQGTAEWLAYRSERFNASDAPAMMNCSPYKTRTQLLNERKTGLTPEVDTHTQRIFNDGHRYEELARPLAEKILGEDLYPVTGSIDFLSASFDGLTMDESIAWEHKSLNDKLRAVNSVEDLPLNYRVQMEQQLLVSGAEKCLFMATKWDNDELVDEKHFFYSSDDKLRDDIIFGWEQFKTDLEDHEVKAVVELPKADAIMDLPAVIVQVKGELTLCNMGDVRPQFDDFLANAITIMVTDEDFAMAEEESKLARKTAKRCLDTAKGVVDQTSSISEVTRELELYASKFNALALSQEKAVKTQKEARKVAIMSDAVIAFQAYKNVIEDKIKPIRLEVSKTDFAGAMKNKRTIASLEDAVASELASAKIEADRVSNEILEKLNYLNEEAKNLKFLFTDLQSIIYMQKEHYEMTIRVRIDSYKKAEADKLEAQRMQIELDAKRKAEAEQAEKLEAERAIVRAEEQAKIAKERAEQDSIDKVALDATREKLEAEAALQVKELLEEKAVAGMEISFRDDSFTVIPTLIKPLQTDSNQAVHILNCVSSFLGLSHDETADILDSIDWGSVKELTQEALT
jgi:putative phage-type endonuclease